MSAKCIGFIGGGRVAAILLGGWSHAGIMPPKITVFDPNGDALERLKTQFPQVAATSDLAAPAGQELVFLAVHPPVIKDALPLLKPHLKRHSMLISLAPKFSTAKLSEMLGGFNRIARVIPNAPSVVGRGFNPVSFAAQAAENKDDLLQLLRPLGDCLEVPEAQLEAYAIVAAMGPTYFWPQLYELKALGESFGLSPQAAMEAVDKMLWGSVATMKESGLSAEQVQDLIPVKPLAEEMPGLLAAYRAKLTGLMEKIRP